MHSSSSLSRDMALSGELNPNDACKLFQDAQNFDIGVVSTNLRILLPWVYAIPSLLLSLRIMVLLIKERKKEEFDCRGLRLSEMDGEGMEE